MDLGQMPKESTLCFTGHRPEKLPRGAALDHLLAALYYQIDHAVRRGYTFFLTGMADGIDFYATEYLISLKMTHPELTIIGVQPCMDYEEFFRIRRYDMQHLRIMQRGVDCRVALQDSYRNPGVFLQRNRYMVERSSALIAVCSEGRSGSAFTYHYAQKLGLSICRLFPHVRGGEFLAPEEWPTEKQAF